MSGNRREFTRAIFVRRRKERGGERREGKRGKRGIV